MYREAAPDRSLLIVAFSGQVFAVDRATGIVRWEVTTVHANAVEIFLTETVVIAATTGHLLFIDYLTGALHATVPLRRATMLFEGEHIYVGDTGEASCYTLRGDLVWSQHFKGKGQGDVALGLPGNVRQADANT
jgi:outer membrane protein assembly factor BamB